MSDHKSIADVFNRPPRVHRRWRVEAVELPEPPVPPRRHEQSALLAYGMPLLSAALMVAVYAAIGRGAGGYGLLLGAPLVLMAVMGAATTFVGSRAQRRRDEAELQQRRRFFEQRLHEQERRIEELYAEEQRIRREANPGLEELLKFAGALGTGMQPQERFWERREGDPDFLEFAIGVGRLPFSSTIKVPRPRPEGAVDPRPFELERRYRMLDEVPVTVPLRELGSLGVAGPRADGLALLRALIWQAAVFHAPNELRLAVVYPRDAARDWSWVPWLPHTVPLSNDAEFHARMHASEDEAVSRLMSGLLDQLSRRRDQRQQQGQEAASPPAFTPVLVVVDGVERVRDEPLLSEIMRDGPRYNMFALFLARQWQDIPSECRAMLDLQGQARWARAGHEWSGEPFSVDTAAATVGKSESLARTIAPLRVVETGSSQDVPRSVRLFELLGIKDEADLLPPQFWAQPPAANYGWHADVPIGLKAGKQPLYFNLYEQAHGSHGIIAGATGAGKSVLLQSIIAALAVKHSPLQLQLLLIDFKGGASLAQLAKLPHTVGFVTDLEGGLAERAMTAIKSELRHRKTMLRQAEAEAGSKVENLREYREKPHGQPPLANLLIVIDEFDEMMQSHKGFVAELVRVVKQGRSLGVHLMVASQQPAKAVTDDIRTQLKFFIALRLGSSQDSREMLQKPDAAFLPTDIPGRAYFRVGAEASLFQVAQVTGAYYKDARADRAPVEVVIDGLRKRPAGGQGGAQARLRDEARRTDLDVLVDTLRQAGPAFFAQQGKQADWRPRPIWQPPLPAHLPLSEVWAAEAGEQRLEQALAQSWQQPRGRDGWLRAVVGRLDIPQASRQEPLRIGLADGHVAIIGASGSGKTMLLRTLLLSLALAHSPQDVWCYVIDAGGQGLSQLAQLPQVGAVIQTRERERVRRLLSMLHQEVARRQERFRGAGVSDLPGYRRERGPDLPAWVLVIDRLALLREEFKDKDGYETITEELVRLARVGRACGIHLVISADSTRDMTQQLFSLMDTRVALRLPDIHDYSEVLGGRVSSQIPAALPGRGLWMRSEQDILELQVALPLLRDPGTTQAGADGQAGAGAEAATLLDSELRADLKETIGRIAEAWRRLPASADHAPAPVLLLPEQIALDRLPAGRGEAPAPEGGISAPIGVEGASLGACYLSFSPALPHALVYGGRRSGKTTLLRTALQGLAQRYSPSELRVVIVDGSRRSLAGFRDLPHVEAYAAGEPEIQGAVPQLEQVLARASAGDGCRRVIVVDDYDIGYKHMEGQFRSAYGESNLFGALRRAAIYGGEWGVHLLVAVNAQYAEEAGDLIRTLDAGRNGLILWSHKYDRARLLDVPVPFGERDGEQPRGRGLLVQEDALVMVQVALAEMPASVEQIV